MKNGSLLNERLVPTAMMTTTEASSRSIDDEHCRSIAFQFAIDVRQKRTCRSTAYFTCSQRQDYKRLLIPSRSARECGEVNDENDYPRVYGDQVSVRQKRVRGKSRFCVLHGSSSVDGGAVAGLGRPHFYTITLSFPSLVILQNNNHVRTTATLW